MAVPNLIGGKRIWDPPCIFPTLHFMTILRVLLCANFVSTLNSMPPFFKKIIFGGSTFDFVLLGFLEEEKASI